MERSGLGRHLLLFEPCFAAIIRLDSIGTEVWRLIDGRRSIKVIATAIRDRFPGVDADVAKDVRLFIADLAKRGFVTFPNSPFLQPSASTGSSAPIRNGKTESIEEQGLKYALDLADGSRLAIAAADADAERVVERFALAARLAPVRTSARRRRILVAAVPNSDGAAGRPLRTTDPAACLIDRFSPGPLRQVGRSRGSIRLVTESEWLWRQLVRLSSFIGREAQACGGVLLHGALAVYSPPGRTGGEAGVLLAGRSGVGKSTASGRLPQSWRSLCDDTALVVRREDGSYWAHPWPTWSRFFAGGTGHGWEVQHAVPLRAVFILEQAKRESVQPSGPSEAVCMLSEIARQAARHLWRGAGPAELAAFHRQRFDNLCGMAQALPVHLLDVSLKGHFWREMERVLE